MRPRCPFFALVPLLLTACVGEPVDPSRAADHPANPRAPETATTAAPPGSVPVSAAGAAPAPEMQDMPGMKGMDHSHMHHAADGGT